MGKIICPHCGKRTDEELDYCTKCWTRLKPLEYKKETPLEKMVRKACEKYEKKMEEKYFPKGPIPHFSPIYLGGF